MGRRPTTGRFATREELVEKVVFLARISKLKTSEIAANCGISPPTVDNILKQASPAKSVAKTEPKPRTRAKPAAKSIGATGVVGLWCWCFQQVEGIGEIPFEAEITKDLGSRWELKIKGRSVVVNRGACSSTPFLKRGKEK